MEAFKTFENLSEADKILFFQQVLGCLNSTSPTKEQSTSTTAKCDFGSLYETVTNGLKRPAETSPSDHKKKQKTLDSWVIKRNGSSSNNSSQSMVPLTNGGIIPSPSIDTASTLPSVSIVEETPVVEINKEKSTVPSRNESSEESIGTDKQSDVSSIKNKRSMLSLNIDEGSTLPSVSTAEKTKVVHINKEKSTVPSRNESSEVSIGTDKQSDVSSIKNKRSKLSLNIDEGSTVSPVSGERSTVSPTIHASTVSPIDKRSTVSPITDKQTTASIINKRVSSSIIKNISTISINCRRSTRSPVRNRKYLSDISPVTVSSIRSEKSSVSYSSEKSSVSYSSETSYNLRSKRKSSNSPDNSKTKTIKKNSKTTVNNDAASNLNKSDKGQKNETDTRSQFSQDLPPISNNDHSVVNDSESLNNNTVSPHFIPPCTSITNNEIVKHIQNAVQNDLEKRLSNEKFTDSAASEKNSSVINYEAFCKFRLECSHLGLDVNDILQNDRLQNFLKNLSGELLTDAIVLIGLHKNDSELIEPVLHTHVSESKLIEQLHKMQRMLLKEK